jgi:hypothetical protein
MIKFFNRKSLFILLMSISTLALAGSAAYYSVFGLSSLFAGARFEVVIMAGSLEFSKLIIASYLHNNWKSAGWMKWYLTLAVGVLMVITSAGIYGFLTSAYQKTADQLGVLDKQVQVIDLKKSRFQEQLDYFNIEKNQLSESITELRNGLSNNVVQYRDKETGQIITTTSSSQRRALERQLTSAVESRDGISIKIEVLTDSITSLDLKVLDLESNNEVAAEVGPLRYMSEITGQPMNVIVNWFTLLIVFVFDPLAISMVIALNKLTSKTIDVKLPIYEEEELDEVIDDVIVPELTKVPVVPKSEPIEKEDVTFIPTDDDARKLYGENRKSNSKIKHTYKNTSTK